jgi:ribonuclease VapC
MIQHEPGGEKVESLLDSIQGGAQQTASLSWVNWCEILTRTQRDFPAMTGEDLTASLTGVELVPFDGALADLAAGYATVSRSLSLGDRACLALAKSRSATAWTADRIWLQFSLDVPVKLIRP